MCVAVGERVPDQHVLTHWGLNVASRAEVDSAYAAALAQQQRYGIRKIQSVRERHGAYGFYLQDRDGNWWEIQYEARSIDEFFSRGDVVEPSAVTEMDSAETHA